MSNNSKDAILLSSLINHKIHQDKLLWNRAHIAFLIEAAVLSAGYALYDSNKILICILLLLLGSYLLFKINQIIKNDMKDRDINNYLIDQLARLIIPEDIKKLMKNEDEANKSKYLKHIKNIIEEDIYFWFTDPNKNESLGSNWYVNIIKYFAILNIILAFIALIYSCAKN